MQDRWESYPCTVNDLPAFIAVNLGFGQRAEAPTCPSLAVFRVRIQAPDERGFPQRDEAEALNTLEDELAALIEPADGIQVGRLTCDGHREIAFYTQLDEAACLRLLDQVATSHGYHMGLLHRPEPERNFYWQVLYPGPREWQRMASRQVIQQLSARGDVLQSPRPIDHFACFARGDDAQAFGRALGSDYTVSSIGQSADAERETHVVAFQHQGVPTEALMSRHTDALVQLAQHHDGRYDGWGCPAEVDDGPTHTWVNNDVCTNMASHLINSLDAGDFDRLLADTEYCNAEDLERMIYGLASQEGAVERAARWAHACPDVALAQVVLGVSMIVQGWRARGDGYAHEVADEAWGPFLASLDSARTPLQRAIELAPDMPEPHAWLIIAEMAGGGADEAKRAHFDAAVARDPQHWPAHMKYFVSLTDKWGGSHTQMFDFAQSCSATASPGDIRHVLVAMAFNEYALAVGASEWPALRTEANAQRIRLALYNWLDTSPEGLTDALCITSGSFFTTGVNQFATACYLCGADAEALALTQSLYGEIESTPWAWLALNEWEKRRAVRVHDRILRTLRQASPTADGAILH